QADQINGNCRVDVVTFSRSKENHTMASRLRQIIFGRGKALVGRGLTFEAEKEHDQVDHEQQHTHAFQQEHPAIVLVSFQQLIQIVQRLELLLDGLVPVGKMEPRGDVFVNTGQMPVTEKFRNVRELIV